MGCGCGLTQTRANTEMSHMIRNCRNFYFLSWLIYKSCISLCQTPMCHLGSDAARPNVLMLKCYWWSIRRRTFEERLWQVWVWTVWSVWHRMRTWGRSASRCVTFPPPANWLWWSWRPGTWRAWTPEEPQVRQAPQNMMIAKHDWELSRAVSGRELHTSLTPTFSNELLRSNRSISETCCPSLFISKAVNMNKHIGPTVVLGFTFSQFACFYLC